MQLRSTRQPPTLLVAGDRALPALLSSRLSATSAASAASSAAASECTATIVDGATTCTLHRKTAVFKMPRDWSALVHDARYTRDRERKSARACRWTQKFEAAHFGSFACNAAAAGARAARLGHAIAAAPLLTIALTTTPCNTIVYAPLRRRRQCARNE